MRILTVLISFLFIIQSCKTVKPFDITVLPVHTSQDNEQNKEIRALEVDKNYAYFAGTNGEVGIYNFKTSELKTTTITDSLEFGSLAIQEDKFYVLSIGSPAILVALDKDLNYEKYILSLEEEAFFDSMATWNDSELMMIGDATSNCMDVVKFNTKTNAIAKISCKNLPVIKEGEAAFAASDTNLIIQKDDIWIATGGKTSRIYHSDRRNLNFTSYDVPIIQGKNTQGLYSIDFYNDKIGVGIGGDYTQPKSNSNNLILTTNGGESWTDISSSTSPSYRSCIQFFPNSNGEKMIAVGKEGTNISLNQGKTWKSYNITELYTIRFINKQTAMAAGSKGVYKIIFSVKN